MGTKVTLTRPELYALVWAEPLPTLAKRYRLSEYAFRQVCIRLSVPLPRSQHWKKVHAGKYVPKAPPLPAKIRGDQTAELTVNIPEKAPMKRTRAAEDPLVTTVRQHLQLRAREWLNNGLAWSREGFLNIVSPAQIGRACNVMNELLHALKIKGYTVQVKGDAANNEILLF